MVNVYREKKLLSFFISKLMKFSLKIEILAVYSGDIVATRRVVTAEVTLGASSLF